MSLKKLFWCLLAGASLSMARILLCQPLSPLEVVEAMKAPEVKASFEQCAQGLPHPDLVKLAIIINEDGTMALQSTIPELEANIAVCFTTVMGTVKIRAVGQKYKMVYSLSLPPAPEVIVQPVPPQPPAPVPEPASAAALETPPEHAYSQPYDDERWLSEYRRGTAFFVVGLILTIGGGVMVIYPMIYGFMMAAICNDTYDSDCESFNPYLLGVGLGGVAVLGTGIGLLISGMIKRSHAGIIKKGCAWQGLTVAPDIAGRGAMMSSVWRF